MNTKQKDFIKQCSTFFELTLGASIEVSDFIACQMALESHFGDCMLAKTNNNLFGMKRPKRRITFAMHLSKSGFAAYSSNIMCMFDYCLWMAWYNFEQNVLKDLDAFKTKLEACGYCPESDYITKITNLLKSYKNE